MVPVLRQKTEVAEGEEFKEVRVRMLEGNTDSTMISRQR